jgi:threonine/homoserine/homoserine lactone efflux protein
MAATVKEGGMEALFVTAVGLGVAFAAAPGAVNAEAFRRGLAHGFRPSLLVQVGAVVGDLLWATVALTGVALSLQNEALHLLLGVIGGCFLLRLAWRALREAARPGLPVDTAGSARGAFMTGAFFSLANPFALAFWLGMGSGAAALVDGESRTAGLVVFLAGFVVGTLLWGIGSALAIARGRRFLGPTFFRWLNALCGLALGYFGLRLVWQTFRALRAAQVVRLLLA